MRVGHFFLAHSRALRIALVARSLAPKRWSALSLALQLALIPPWSRHRLRSDCRHQALLERYASVKRTAAEEAHLNYSVIEKGDDEETLHPNTVEIPLRCE